MKKRQMIAMVASTVLAGSELLLAAEPCDERKTFAVSPHGHVEMPELTINPTNLMVASGGQVDQTRYYLRIGPQYAPGTEGGDVVGYRAYGYPNSGSQEMSGYFDSLDSTIAALKSHLGLPPLQLAATRSSLLAGITTEVGGHAARMFWQRETLANLGLKFGLET